MDREQVRQLLEALRVDGDQTSHVDLVHVVIALVLTLLASIVIGRVYRYTHRGPGYSQSFVQTLTIVSLVTCAIMIIVGSNIARAFSLLGALSIIRFRNAVKETRDVGVIFLCMGVAMAMGTRFFAIGLLLTAVTTATAVAFRFLDYGAPRGVEHLLRIDVPTATDFEATFGPVLAGLFDRWARLRVESADDGLTLRTVLTVAPREGVTAERVIETLVRHGGTGVSYDLRDETAP